MKIIITFLLLSLSFISIGQLELGQIMAGNNFIGHQPYNIQWSPNSKIVYFRWQHQSESVAPYYSASTKNTKPQLLPNKDTHCKTTNGFYSDNNNKHIYFIKNNGLYKWSENESTLLIQKSNYFRILNILKDGGIILQENDNLFHFNPNSGTYIQLTDIVKGSESIIEPEPTYLDKQQEELFDIIKQNNTRQIAKDAFNDEFNKNTIPKIYLNGQTLGWIHITNDLKHLIYRLDNYPQKESTHIEQYITKNGYTKSITARAKVGKKILSTNYLF